MNKTQSGAEWAVTIVTGTGEPGYSGMDRWRPKPA